ncbi:MAG: hypothetical protein GEV03_01620 [Streptosporangiales bacterium]|nr:hypothetical protein [Streptosporangiales bacterium]
MWGTNEAAAISQQALEQIRDDLDRGLLTTVQDRWEGDAYVAFEEYMKVIQQAIEEEADRFPQVGHVLVEIADAFDASIADMIGYAYTVEGILVSVAGVAIAAGTGLTGVGAIAGLIVSLLGLVLTTISGLHTLLSTIIPQLLTVAAAGSAIRREATAKNPLDFLPHFPSDVDDWIPKSP